MTPPYSDKSRFSFLDLALPVITGWLLIQGLTGGGYLPVLFGLGGAAYLLFTRHRRYDLFEDALVVRYLVPRTLVVYLSDVQEVRPMKQPMTGPVLLIQRKAGTRLMIKPADYDAFLARLTDALSKGGAA